MFKKDLLELKISMELQQLLSEMIIMLVVLLTMVLVDIHLISIQLLNTNYCFTIMARDADASEPGAANLAAVTSNSTKTTSALKVISAYAPTTTASDTTEYNVIIFGELS